MNDNIEEMTSAIEMVMNSVRSTLSTFGKNTEYNDWLEVYGDVYYEEADYPDGYPDNC